MKESSNLKLLIILLIFLVVAILFLLKESINSNFSCKEYISFEYKFKLVLNCVASWSISFSKSWSWVSLSLDWSKFLYISKLEVVTFNIDSMPKKNTLSTLPEWILLPFEISYLIFFCLIMMSTCSYKSGIILFNFENIFNKMVISTT